MRVLRTLAELAALQRDVFLAIGVFDGVHLGHQRVIRQACDDAKTTGGLSAVLTFNPHPSRILRPQNAPALLTSNDHKLALIRQLGVDICVLVSFDKTFSEIPAERFIEQIAFCRQVSIGTRFQFGHNRAGNVALMEKLASRHGFVVKEIKSVHTPDGEMVSSTAVRQHVLAGRLGRAAAMLGRPYSILGTVEKGDGVGHQLGFPTANLNPHNEAFPPDGVYAAQTVIAGQTFGSILNLGCRPTFTKRSHQRILEVHILDFNRDLYGETLEVVFAEKLRDERKFSSPAELRIQIAADLAAARQLYHTGD